MSGLVQWTSKAKRKPVNKGSGKKPNPRRQRILAAKRRNMRVSARKAAAESKRAE